MSLDLVEVELKTKYILPSTPIKHNLKSSLPTRHANQMKNNNSTEQKVEKNLSVTIE